jgi:hypothetical protein
MRALGWMMALTLAGPAAWGGETPGEGDGPPKGVHAVRSDDEITVFGDLFARWDDTRWYIATEVQLPATALVRSGTATDSTGGASWFVANQNYEMRVAAYQVRAVLACGKDWKLSGRKYEVSCVIEDFGLQALVFERKYKHAQAILDEYDRKFTGARVQLQVKDNGRVTNIDLEDMPDSRNARERRIEESMRQIMSRLVVGYDMKLRKANYLSSGQWVETRSALLSMPSSTLAPSSGLIVHQLNGYKGHVVVQTKGEGQMVDDQGVTYKADITGVSIYDDDEGYMTERVWMLVARPTVSTGGNFDTGNTPSYTHSGVLRLLGDAEVVDVGPTRRVGAPGADADDFPPWVPLEPGS